MPQMLSSLLCGLVAVLTAIPVSAQNHYPDKPISIIVPFAPGGATDVTARMLAEQISQDTGYQLIVENKGGAGGGIAASQVARAAPDGYTVLFGTSNTNGINSFIYKLNYDPVKSFEPVGLVAENVVVLLANASFPADTLEQAIALIKKSPDEYSYASPGLGTVHNLSMELLKKAEGLDLMHVPYKGAGPAMIDLVAGTVPLMIGGIAPAKSFIASGKVKVLAVANERKFEGLPADAQYFSDVVPQAAVSSWMGLFMPAGTPPDRVETLSKALQKALQSPKLQETLQVQGMQAEYMGPKAFSDKVGSDMDFWKQAVETTGLESH
ncbi:Bug family tripartite tricarboxylate transporter substrate binding protein [Allopusillimonas ginsengisoli]|uniref:Bug family tripartite tricarboxylate transporter substrate binding protein n=1 Tax=Allopusillimonas ginsengisoli TaxID=453575 RepID=UPI001FD63AD1|nr:tripartite tricarboxylate transporter substrate binding protein [Allopusillimonas ginsengisoli]